METLLTKPGPAVRRVTRREEVPLLYWSAASLGLQISAGRNLPALVARIPEVEALIERAVELDANWGKGSAFRRIACRDEERRRRASSRSPQAARSLRVVATHLWT